MFAKSTKTPGVFWFPFLWVMDRLGGGLGRNGMSYDIPRR
jgi:hypothetical protein